jgi:hypothetical protein
MTISTTTLKNAAFAIEHDLLTKPDGSHWLVKDGAILRRWEPETSSADAFDLAADLRFDMMINGCGTEVFSADLEDCVYQSAIDDDTRQSTRFAIVIAAGQIGASICQ